jgi:hypothetical protein
MRTRTLERLTAKDAKPAKKKRSALLLAFLADLAVKSPGLCLRRDER